MGRFRLGVVAVVVIFAMWAPARADEFTSEKRASIRELMAVTGSTDPAAQLADALVAQLTASLGAANANLPPWAADVLEDEVRGVVAERDAPGVDPLIERVVAVYERNLTLDDTRELLAFYRTPLGKKVLEVMPVLARETAAVGQAWGQALMPVLEERLTRRFAAKGVE